MNELISKFPNGQKLFETNATFNNIVRAIYEGLSLYDAISVFAEQNQKQWETIKEIIEKLPTQPKIIKE